MTAPAFTVVVDTREQRPLGFGDWPVIVKGLRSGDYSIEGYEDRVALERKSLPDLYACVGRERARFERELQRLSRFDHAALVIEASLAEVARGFERSTVSPKAAVGSLVSWSVRYGVPVWLCGTRRLAAGVVLKTLAKWFEHRRPAIVETGEA